MSGIHFGGRNLKGVAQDCSVAGERSVAPRQMSANGYGWTMGRKVGFLTVDGRK